MSVRDGKACGVPARLMRVSFTGELGYEINVGSAYGLDVWKARSRKRRSTAAAPTAPRRCTCCAPRRAT